MTTVEQQQGPPDMRPADLAMSLGQMAAAIHGSRAALELELGQPAIAAALKALDLAALAAVQLQPSSAACGRDFTTAVITSILQRVAPSLAPIAIWFADAGHTRADTVMGRDQAVH